MAKGMGIKTSVKSGNFRPTKQGAGMTKKALQLIARPIPAASFRRQSRKKILRENVRLVASLFVLAWKA